MIDSHCHLADKQFLHDLEEIIIHARDAGVDHIITIADTLEEGERCIEIAMKYSSRLHDATKKYPNIFATVGVHPHNATQWRMTNGQAPTIKLRSLLESSTKVVAVGEIGLDYHYMNSPKVIQQNAFKEQLQLAKELVLPAVIHSREALEDTWNIIRETCPEKCVLHCCTEQWKNVKRFIDAGYFLSFTGIATYPKSDEIRHTIRECPLNQIMIETDAPYLPPEALRVQKGTRVRNEPANVLEIAKCIAETKGISLEEVDRITTRNAIKFFTLPS